MKKNYFSLILSFALLFLLNNTHAQSLESCAQENHREYVEQKDPASIQRRIAMEKQVKLIHAQEKSVTNIPIKAYILRQSNGSGGISECDLKDAIDVANVQFIPAMYNLVVCALEYIDSDTYYNIGSFGEGDNLYFSNNDPSAMNIYFVNSAAGYCGWANFPWSSDRYIMMDNSCAMNTSTLAHEIGHYFGLYHTHQGGNELVNGSNCSSAGDLLCDTPADPNISGLVNGSCQYTGNATDANGDTYVPDPLNMMSYSQKHCRDIFTTDQVARMDHYYNTVRAAQLTCSGTVGICCPDDDGDGVCNVDDQCPGFNDNLIGTACEDGDPCTTGETYDNDCDCTGGTSSDSDGDGVCDALDVCQGHDDNMDSDNDGIPDGCDNNCTELTANFPVSQLSHSGSGWSSTTLDFGGNALDVSFTVSDINQKLNGKSNRRYIELVEISYVDDNGGNVVYGTYSGANVSSVDVLISGPISSVTVSLSDDYDGNGPNGMSISFSTVDYCGIACSDSDNDGVCDSNDACPGFDDNIDSDGDGIPDGCDNCTAQTASFSPDPLTHTGTGSSSSQVIITNGEDVSFSVGNLGSKINGSPSNRYIDVVDIEYEDVPGNTINHGTFYGDQQNNVDVFISGNVYSVKITLSDGYDGDAPSISVNPSNEVEYCPSALDEEIGAAAIDVPFTAIIFPNPTKGMLTIDASSPSYSIKVYNIFGGMELNMKDVSRKKEINISDLAAGIYIVVIESESEMLTKRLIKH